MTLNQKEQIKLHWSTNIVQSQADSYFWKPLTLVEIKDVGIQRKKTKNSLNILTSQWLTPLQPKILYLGHLSPSSH